MKDFDDDILVQMDTKLYQLINSFLANGNENYHLSSHKEMFEWYCDIRNNIVNKIMEVRDERNIS